MLCAALGSASHIIGTSIKRPEDAPPHPQATALRFKIIHDLFNPRTRTEPVVMIKRTETANEKTISLPKPDGRLYDFTSTPDEAPHAVKISVPPESSFAGPVPYWNETYKVLLTCIAGTVHCFSGTGPYYNVDTFFSAGNSETYEKFTLHYWQREEQWQTAKTPLRYRSQRPSDNEREHLLDEHRDIEKCIDRQVASDDVLTVALSPSTNHWDQDYVGRHELFYRNWASMELDAPLYPYLPTTPLPIRLLFKLPRFLFPEVVRKWFIDYFFSFQTLVLFSAFDHHPYLGAWPLMTLYSLAHFGKYIWMGAPQIPQWVCRCQWTSMLWVSHSRVWLWSLVGKWVLGMQPTYEEYTPERLKHVLDPRPDE